MPFTVVPIDSNFFNELSELLSQLRIKAEMALDGHWDRCHEGYIAQIDDINSFAKKFENPSLLQLNSRGCLRRRHWRYRLHQTANSWS